MNRCWQVARTYLGRWRFWIFGGVYAGVALRVVPSYWSPPQLHLELIRLNVGLIISLVFACVVGCLAALHLRRLLSGPTAHAVPDFWGPHLLVGAVVSLAIWAGLPLAQAQLADVSPLRVVALNSLAGIVPALVLLWPRAIFSLSLIPVLLVWAAAERPGSALLVRFFDGEEPMLSIAAILLAILAYPAAALVLWLTRDRAATFSDDLVIDRTHEIASRWKGPLLQLRDAAIEWRLGGAGHFAWPLRRWLIPCAASWTEMGLLVALVIVVMTVTGLTARDAGVSLFVASVAGLVVLFIPLSSWRFRCTALAAECTRPVARRQFVRQFLCAMLCDFAVWTAVAAMITVAGYLPLFWMGEPDVLWVLGIHFTGLGSASIWLYGTALATLRLRYWMPWFLGLLVATLVVASNLIGYLMYLWLEVFEFPEQSVFGPVLIVAVFGGTGLLLGSLIYRCWLRMDVA